MYWLSQSARIENLKGLRAHVLAIGSEEITDLSRSQPALPNDRATRAPLVFLFRTNRWKKGKLTLAAMTFIPSPLTPNSNRVSRAILFISLASSFEPTSEVFAEGEEGGFFLVGDWDFLGVGGSESGRTGLNSGEGLTMV